MNQETLKEITSITPAPGWRAVFAEEKDGGGLKAAFSPGACFVAIRETYMNPGCRYRYDWPPHEQDISEVISYVEMHVEAGDGDFGCPINFYGFYRFMGPGEEWDDDKDLKFMEDYFARKNREQKAEAACKRAEEEKKKGGEASA